VGGSSSPVPTRRILGTRVDATSCQHAAAEILPWASLTPDGVPLVWALRLV
jgi:hypothetical protein